MVSEIKDIIPVYVQPSDALKMAASSAVEAIKAGAEGIVTSTVGPWLRADVLSDILRARGYDLQTETSLDKTNIH